jgi:hypothetical protein
LRHASRPDFFIDSLLTGVQLILTHSHCRRQHHPFAIVQEDEEKVVTQDSASCEEIQETMAL